MTVTKKIISYIIAIVMAVLIIALTVLSCINYSLLSKNKVKADFQKTDYYYSLHDIIIESCENNIMPTGFDDKVLEDVITVEKVQDDVNGVIDSLYENKKVEISTKEMREKLDQNVKLQIEEKNFEMNEEAQKNVKEFEDEIIDTYKNNINYSEDIVEQMKKGINIAKQSVKIAIIVLIIAIIILTIILYVLNKTAIGVSMLISGVFLIALKLYSGTTMAINNILLLNWAFSKTLTYIVNTLFQNMYKIGIILAVIGILTIIINEVVNAVKEIKNKN